MNRARPVGDEVIALLRARGEKRACGESSELDKAAAIEGQVSDGFSWMTWPREEISDSSKGAAAATVTSVEVPPTARLKFTSRRSCTRRSTSVLRSAWKPSLATATSYWPGRKPGAEYKPVSFVTSVRRTFVFCWIKVTDAPGTAAPLESVTKPEIVPVSTCATAVASDMTNRVIRLREIRLMNSPETDTDLYTPNQRDSQPAGRAELCIRMLPQVDRCKLLPCSAELRICP